MGLLSGIVKTVFGDGGAEASLEAGRLQSEAAMAGVDETRRQFDITQEQFAPFREAGLGALSQQQALLGLSGQGAQEQAFSQLQESPSQRFLRERGQRNLLQNASAIGGLGGGNVRSALVEQGVGFAQQDLENQLSRLGGISGAGMTATQNIGQLGGQASGNIANLLGQSGQAQASGILGAQQARAAGQSQLLGAGVGALAGSAGLFGAGIGAGGGAALGLLSDKNMKTDINDLSLEECYNAVINMPLKSWRYLEEVGLGTDLHLGPMAQDAPEAIKIEGKEMLNLHDELMLIAGALQYAKQEGLCH